MGMTRGAKHSRGHGGGNLGAAATKQRRVGTAASLFGLCDEKLHSVFFRTRDKQTEAVEQAARADAQRFRRNGFVSHIFNEFGGGFSGFQSGGNHCEGILFSHILFLSVEIDCYINFDLSTLRPRKGSVLTSIGAIA